MDDPKHQDRLESIEKRLQRAIALLERLSHRVYALETKGSDE